VWRRVVKRDVHDGPDVERLIAAVDALDATTGAVDCLDADIVTADAYAEKMMLGAVGDQGLAIPFLAIGQISVERCAATAADEIAHAASLEMLVRMRVANEHRAHPMVHEFRQPQAVFHRVTTHVTDGEWRMMEEYEDVAHGRIAVSRMQRTAQPGSLKRIVAVVGVERDEERVGLVKRVVA